MVKSKGKGPRKARRPAAKTARKKEGGPPFTLIFRRYLASVGAVREFLSHLNPVIASLDKDRSKERDERIQTTLSDASKEAIVDLRQFLKRMGSPLDGSPTQTKKSNKEAFKPATVEGEHLIFEMIQEWLSDLVSQPHQELLHRSMLMSLVSYFEVLVADLTPCILSFDP